MMMTRRIATAERIGGQPITRIRSYLRSVNGHYNSVRGVAERFELSDAAARRLLDVLEREGYMERAAPDARDREVYWQITHRGQELAAATAAQPLTRRTADRLLDDIVQRMGEVNRGDYAVRVISAFVFGSYLDASRDRINDVDVAVMLGPRFTDRDAQFAARQARIARARAEWRQFSNLSVEMFWPETEVYLALRRRSRGLSVMLPEAGTERLDVVFGNRHRQIFPVAREGEHPLHLGTNHGVKICACAIQAFQLHGSQ